MFDHTSHDFGMVARGAKVEHRFPLENIYLEDVHIASATPSCTCTSVKITQHHLKTYEKAEIIATINTRQFTGRKDATIRVVLDQPFPAEVQLHTYAYIRTDVVLQPGSVQFGSVPEGTAAERTLSLSHAGASQWQVVGVECGNPYLQVQVVPGPQSAGQVNYTLKFQLKPNTPPGYLRQYVTLLTNDETKQAQRVLVAVEGVVVPTVTISPSPLALGLVRPGGKAVKNLVIHAQQPFRILGIDCPNDRFKFASREKLDVASTLHVLGVTFAAGETPGKIEGAIRIRTDLGGEKTLEVAVTGEVVAGPGGSAVESSSTDKAGKKKDPAHAAKGDQSGWQSVP